MHIAALLLGATLIGQTPEPGLITFTQAELLPLPGVAGMLTLSRFGHNLGDMTGLVVAVPRRGALVFLSFNCPKHEWRIEAWGRVAQGEGDKLVVAEVVTSKSSSDREMSPTQGTWGEFAERVACAKPL